MSRRFLSIALSMILATSSFFTGAASASAADESNGSAEKDSAVASQSSKDDPVTLNIYSYRLSDEGYYDRPVGSKIFSETKTDYHQVKVNRGDTIKVKVRLFAETESIVTSMRVRYDLHKDNLKWTTQYDGKGDEMTGSLEDFMGWYKDTKSTLRYIPRQEGSLISTISDDVFEAVQWNSNWQPLLDTLYYDEFQNPVLDMGVCDLSTSDAALWDGLGVNWAGRSILPQDFSSDLEEVFSKTTFTQESGDDLCTINFKVSDDASLGNEQSILIYQPMITEVPATQYAKIKDVKLEVTGSTDVEPTEPPTEEPTEAPTEEPTEAPTEAPTQAPTGSTSSL